MEKERCQDFVTAGAEIAKTSELPKIYNLELRDHVSSITTSTSTTFHQLPFWSVADHDIHFWI